MVESESSQKFDKSRLDAFSIPHYVIKKGDPMVLGTVKLKHRNSGISPSTRGRDVAEEITKEFTVVIFETKYIVNRNSKLAGPSRSASKWISWHRKTTPTVYPEMNSRDIKDSGISH